MNNISVGVIGYKNHSAKIIKILKNVSNVKTIQVYYHNKISETDKIKSKKIYYTNKINILNDVHAVFICAPPNLHFKYLKKFIKFNKYIFCEKPPVVNKKELKYLLDLPNNKKNLLYFNFNLIFSNFFSIIQKEINNKVNGKLIHININSSHGLSFKKNYLKNWRSSENNISNISGNLGIHFIHLISKLINLPKKIDIYTSSISKKKTFDTANIILIFQKNISANIFLSYSTVKDKLIRFYFTNTIIDVSEYKIIKYTPRNTLNKENIFITPMPKKILTQKSLEQNSLNRSILYFIENIINNKKFKIKDYKLALNVNKLYF